MFVVVGVLEALSPTESQDKQKAAQENEKKETSKWGYGEDVSAMTDNKSVFITLQSDSPLIQSGSSIPVIPQLTFRCMENETSVLLGTGAPLEPEYGNSFGKTIKFRIDNGKAFSAHFGNAQSSYDVFLADNPIDLMKRLSGKEKLLISANYRRNGEMVLEFDLRDFQEKTKPVRELCKWE